jgi:hypothetical protein
MPSGRVFQQAHQLCKILINVLLHSGHEWWNKYCHDEDDLTDRPTVISHQNELQ